MVRAWRVHGACMACAWCVHGACMVNSAWCVRALRHLLECLIVLAEDVDHPVRHRLLMVGPHLRHKPEVEQGHPTVGQAEEVAWLG